jgi:hypothetical protein
MVTMSHHDTDSDQLLSRSPADSILSHATCELMVHRQAHRLPLRLLQCRMKSIEKARVAGDKPSREAVIAVCMNQFHQKMIPALL